jgi:hypothetical protein
MADHPSLIIYSKTTRDTIFIASSILFNILVSTVYVFSKLNQMELVRAIGVPIIMLIIPFAYTLNRFLKDSEEKRITYSNAVIILYLLIELLLDYVLLIPFREILGMHIPYILVFYAAEFSIIGVSFRLNRRMGFIVLFTFFVLLGCLVFSYS